MGNQYAKGMTEIENSAPPQASVLEALKGWPQDVSEGVLAHDATDRLMLDLAADAIEAAAPGTVVVLGDRNGALTLGSAALGATEIRVHQDSFAGRMALEANAARLDMPSYRSLPLGEELLAGATVVLAALPKDLGQLGVWAALIARFAAPSIQVFAGGRVKHMTLSMNQVLRNWFEDVRASRARQKSRVLLASGPVATTSGVGELGVTEAYDADLDLWICSYPGVFAGGKVDIGTRFLIPFVRAVGQEMCAGPQGSDSSWGPSSAPSTSPRSASLPSSSSLVAVDLGCGTGVLASVLVQSCPRFRVVATDNSEVAVRSCEATLQKNFPDLLDGEGSLSGDSGDFEVEVRQDYLLSHQADASVDLVVCNPPFHAQAAISTALSVEIFKDAARVLKPGGIMLTVFNSHLRHRGALQKLVGPTVQLGRNPKFTVTKSVKR